MSSRARAPQTAHLRKTILKVAKKHSHRVPASNKPANLLDVVRNDVMHHWHDVADEKTSYQSTDLFEQPPPHLKVNIREIVEDERSKRLCGILSQIAAKSKTEGNFYCAAAATAAISMVQIGCQDEINPGLWSKIRHIESSSAEHPSI